MATNVNDKENWFGQTNKYKYQDLMIAIYEKDVIDIKAAHKKLGGTGVWIDTGPIHKGNAPPQPRWNISSVLVSTAAKVPMRYVT